MALIDMNITKTDININPPVTSNKRMTYYGNAILLKNSGDETVIINRGLTLYANEVIDFQTASDDNIVSFTMSFIFQGGGVNPRIEVITSLPRGAEYVNYNPQ